MLGNTKYNSGATDFAILVFMKVIGQDLGHSL